jgi:hypothetical protein
MELGALRFLGHLAHGRILSAPLGGIGGTQQVDRFLLGMITAMSGKQIKLFLVDGTPGGLTTAEITNWTGHVLAARRSDLADLLGREEAQRTGVYFLLGDDESIVGDTRCYIGEADVVAERLRYHQRDKEFWDRVVVITSKDSNITKAHGRYLSRSSSRSRSRPAASLWKTRIVRRRPPCRRRTRRTWTISWPSSRSCCRCSESTQSGSAGSRRRQWLSGRASRQSSG